MLKYSLDLHVLSKHDEYWEICSEKYLKVFESGQIHRKVKVTLQRYFLSSGLFPQPHKIVVMTGGNRGIGMAVVKKLLECKMTVIVAVRSPEGCREIIEKAFDESLYKGKMVYEQCDVSNMTSVRNFASKVQEKFSAIHLLINNGWCNGILMILCWIYDLINLQLVFWRHLTS